MRHQPRLGRSRAIADGTVKALVRPCIDQGSAENDRLRCTRDRGHGSREKRTSERGFGGRSMSREGLALSMPYQQAIEASRFSSNTI